MSELLVELFCEEIPARMQTRAADDLRRLVTEGLKARGLISGLARAFATPRRLTLAIDGVGDASPATSEEKKGPRVGAPEQAIAGFLKSTGLASIEQATIVKDAKKGDFYVVRVETCGRPAAEIIAETITETCARFPWPKSMRWGDSPFEWVRPLKSIVCMLGGRVVKFEVAGVQSGDITTGHRFLGDDAIKLDGTFSGYEIALRDSKVILDGSARVRSISEQAHVLAKASKLELIEDEALLIENAGLTEWPVVLLGSFDEGFLDVPAEALITSMKTHQKCFSLRHPRSKKLANKFLLVSNLEAKDGGKSITAGNEKVIHARLSDAKFFWEQDLRHPLGEMAGQLGGITFHEKLGSQKDRVERIEQLAFELAGACDANPEEARRAAGLCKADLVSGMVGEFPELQGLMGRRYAEHAGVKPEIARAIELHYKPKGPSDVVPREESGDAVACAVALADKLDTLVGFWTIGEKPTGSGDPYQLRRAALGVIRIVLENDFRLSLSKEIDAARRIYADAKIPSPNITTDLMTFFADRLKVHLRDHGKRHDLIDAVFALEGQDDLALIVRRVDALDAFLQTDDGVNLLAGVKRAANILSIEEKKDKKSYGGDYDLKLIMEKDEAALAAAIESVKEDTAAAINVENFTGAMRALAELRPPVDAFFGTILVNAADPAIRVNRLRLLSQIRSATLNVADFSKIAG